MTTILAAALLAACGGPSEREMVADAQRLLDKGDRPAAVIQLKNALQKNPQSAEARLMLGRALLEIGDLPSAILELGKALDAGADKNVAVPLRARAILLTGDGKKVLSEYGRTQLEGKPGQAALQVWLAAAHAISGDSKTGRNLLDQALQADPESPAALLLRARFEVAEGQVDAAKKTLENLTAKTPNFDEAWQVRGDVALQYDDDPKQALAHFRKALEIRPDRIPSHAGAVSAAMRLGDDAAFKTELDRMAKVYPDHPETKFFQAQLALVSSDFKRAREMIQQLLRVAPENVKVLTLAGAAEFQSGSLIQAETFLSKALTIAPDLQLARRLLGLTYVRLGKTERALATVLPPIEAGTADADMLSAAAEAYLQAGDFSQANLLLNKASRQSPENPVLKTALAVAEIAKGNASAGFRDLHAISRTDTGTTADLAMITAYLQLAKYDDALQAIDQLEKKQPDRPLAPFMRGRIHHLRNELPQARSSFERALAVEAHYFPAVAALATLDLADKKLDEAVKRFDAVVAAQPGNTQARLAAVDVRRRAGATPQELAGRINDAVKANPSDASARVALVNLYIGARDFKQAQQVAQEAIAALPNSLDVLDAVGRAQIAAGEYNQATSTYKRMANQAPLLAQPHLRLADIATLQKDSATAIASLRKALELAPLNTTAQKGVIRLSLQAKRPQDAIDVARQIQKQRPKDATGFVLEADVHALQRDWPKAEAAYRRALERQPLPEAAIKLHRTLHSMNQTAEAERTAQAWESAHPDDSAFLFVRAEEAMAQKKWSLAETRLRRLVVAKPEDPMVLNNLAWSLLEQDKPGALPLAGKAATLLPDRAAVLDTLARAYQQDKQFGKAAEVLKKAAALAPDDYGIRLKLARVLISAGDRAAAKAELDRLAKVGNSFAQQPQVTELLKTLN